MLIHNFPDPGGYGSYGMRRRRYMNPIGRFASGADKPTPRHFKPNEEAEERSMPFDFSSIDNDIEGIVGIWTSLFSIRMI